MSAIIRKQPAVSPKGGDSPVVGGRHCRQMTSVALRAFFDLLEAQAVDGSVSLDDIRRIAATLMHPQGPLSDRYAHAASTCEATFSLMQVESKRKDQLGRLLAHPFAELLDDPSHGITRPRLRQFFTAIHKILGDEQHDQLRALCAVLVESHRSEDGLVDWEGYYSDPEALAALYQVLMNIANSFKRFDVRRDWFLILMNSTPHTPAMGPGEFTSCQFVALFRALFAPVAPGSFDAARTAEFIRRFGITPDVAFGPFLAELDRLADKYCC